MKGQFKFEGDGKELFSILLINAILTGVTFGIYAPWAMAKVLRYYMSKTTLGGKQFEFKGDGGEMFSLFLIQGILIAVTLYIYMPWAIAKICKYFAQKTELAGKPFDFNGDGAQMFSLFLIQGILTSVTLGIYGAWAYVKILKYFAENTVYEGKSFGFTGEGGELFSIYVIHMGILTGITFGIYFFWAIAKLHNYLISNITYADTDKFELNLEGGQLFSIHVIGMILTSVTFGIYYPWYKVKVMAYYADQCKVN